MEFVASYGLYLFAGLLISLISTFNVKSISLGEEINAAFSSFVSIFISTYIILDIIKNINEVGYIAVIFYAAGFSVGSYIITKYKKRRVE